MLACFFGNCQPVRSAMHAQMVISHAPLWRPACAHRPPEACMVTGSKRQQPRIELEPSPWLEYAGRWGSTVDAPAQQEWFARAENPVSRSWLAQVRPASPAL